MYEKIYYSLHDKKNEYRRETNYSKEGIQWLEYLRAEHNLDIRHVLNASHGEKRIGNYRLQMDFVDLITLYANIMSNIIMVIVGKIKIQRNGRKLKNEKKSY